MHDVPQIDINNGPDSSNQSEEIKTQSYHELMDTDSTNLERLNQSLNESFNEDIADQLSEELIKPLIRTASENNLTARRVLD